MKPYQLSLYEKSMPDNAGWMEKLFAAREAGFDALEISIDESDRRLARLDWTPQERRQLLLATRDAGVPINTMCLSAHRKYPLGTGRPEAERRAMEIMEKAIALACDLGVRIIQVTGYDVTYGEPSTPATEERFLRNLAKSTEMAASRGVILALETMETDFMNTVEKAMYAVSVIGSPYLKVYPDIGNLTNATAHVARDLRAGAGSIVAAHLKETKAGIFRNLSFGEGRVDFPMAVGVLKSLGVRYFNAEFWYDGKENWRGALKHAADFLTPVLQS